MGVQSLGVGADLQEAVKGDSLGDRMKRYEAVADATLMRRAPAIVRVDGKAFHSLTRGMQKPFDPEFSFCMVNAASALVLELQGAKLAYVQSDEISVVLTDYDTLQTDAWFAYRVQKMASVAASIATAAFTEQFQRYPHFKGRPLFDGRVFSLPSEDEVVNYLIWRQQDDVRNSIQATGQAHFSAKQLHGKNQKEIQEMLFQERGINWNDTPTYLKRGVVVSRESVSGVGDTIRHQIDVNYDIPVFTADRLFILNRLPGTLA